MVQLAVSGSLANHSSSIDALQLLPFYVPTLYLNHSAGARVSCLAGCKKLVDTPISADHALQETSKIPYWVLKGAGGYRDTGTVSRDSFPFFLLLPWTFDWQCLCGQYQEPVVAVPEER